MANDNAASPAGRGAAVAPNPVAKPVAGPTRADERMNPAIGLVRRIPPRLRMPLAAYAVCQMILLLWWLAYYPGLTSYDSIQYTVQVTTGPLINNYSVLYDALVWLSLHLSGSYAALTFAQTVAAAAVFGYTVAAMRKLGVPGRWTAIAAVVLAALPPTGTLIVFVWKDTAFTLCSLAMVPTLAKLVALRRDGITGRAVTRQLAVLGLEVLGLTLFRPNGFLFAALATVVLLLVLRGIRLRLAGVTAIALCVYALLNFVVYPGVGIEKPPTSLVFGPAYADIAVAYAEDPRTFTPADTRLMEKVAPLAAWRKSADCYTSDTTTSAAPGFVERAAKVNSQLFALWVRVLKRTPNLIAGARICRASIAWSLFSNPAEPHGSLEIGLDSPTPDLFGLGNRPGVRHNPYRWTFFQHPPSLELHKAAHFLYVASQTRQLQWLLWRGPFWCYLSYLVLFLYARARRNWAVLSLGAILAAMQIGILADNPAQLYRYMTSPIFIGIMLLPLLFARHRQRPAASAQSG